MNKRFFMILFGIPTLVLAFVFLYEFNKGGSKARTTADKGKKFEEPVIGFSEDAEIKAIAGFENALRHKYIASNRGYIEIINDFLAVEKTPKYKSISPISIFEYKMELEGIIKKFKAVETPQSLSTFKKIYLSAIESQYNLLTKLKAIRKKDGLIHDVDHFTTVSKIRILWHNDEQNKKIASLTPKFLDAFSKYKKHQLAREKEILEKIYPNDPYVETKWESPFNYSLKEKQRVNPRQDIIGHWRMLGWEDLPKTHVLKPVPLNFIFKKDGDLILKHDDGFEMYAKYEILVFDPTVQRFGFRFTFNGPGKTKGVSAIGKIKLNPKRMVFINEKTNQTEVEFEFVKAE